MARTKIPDVVISELVVKKAAAIASSGADVNKISELLGITKNQARDILRRDDFKAALESIGDEAIKQAKITLKTEISHMSKEIVRVLYANLEKDNLEAVKIALKVYGIGEDEVKTADTNITVMLPGATEPKDVISVPSDE